MQKTCIFGAFLVKNFKKHLNIYLLKSIYYLNYHSFMVVRAHFAFIIVQYVYIDTRGVFYEDHG